MGNLMSAITARDGSIGHDIQTDGSRHHCVQIEMITTAPAAAAGGGGGATGHQEGEEADMERATITADDPHAGSEEEANTRPRWIEVQIADTDGGEGDVHMAAGISGSIETNHHEAVHIDIITTGGGATEEEEANMERPALTEDDPPIRATPEEIVAGMERGTVTNPINEQQAVLGNRGSGIVPVICASTLSVGATAIFRPTPKGLHSVACLIAAYWLDIVMLLILSSLLLGLTFALLHVPDNWVPAVRAAATTVTVSLLVLLLFFVTFVTYGVVRQDLP